jgi:hypothetical protein
MVIINKLITRFIKYPMHLLIVSLLTFSGLNWASIEVSINKKIISNIESFQLNISLKNIDKNKLNLKVLDKDFTVTDRSEQQSLMFLNGKKTSNHILNLTLTPKRMGQLTIPSFKIGKEKSKTLTIKVTDANKNKITQPIFLESLVNKKEVLVQSQLIYTLNLYSIQPLNAANLPFSINIKNAFIEKLKISKIKTVKHQGKKLYLTQFNYAIFPQKSGSLHIPAIKLNVSLNNQGKIQNIRLFTNAQNIKVKAQPRNIRIPQWLAAKSIKISAKYLKKPPIFKVGEPIIRQITLIGEALSPAQLPDIKIKNVDAFQQYLDKKNDKKVVSEKSITSYKIQDVIIIPNYIGEYVLPEIKIEWYNTQTNKKETAILNAQKIQVIAPKGYLTKKQNTQTIIPKAPINITTNNLKPKIIIKENKRWMWISLLFLILWLATLMICKNKKTKQQNKIKQKKINGKSNFSKKIKKHCYKNDVTKTRQNLILWAKENIDKNINGLEILAKVKHFASIQQELLDLDKLLYLKGNTDKKWNGSGFWKLLKPLLELRKTTNQEEKLKSFYPD